MRKFAEFLVVALSLSVFAMFVGVFILDWTGGCGEMFQYADGTWHQGECLGRELFNSFLGDL